VTKTYVDSGVLIAVVRGDPLFARQALSVLEDSNRTFVASVFLRLELLPKAIYHRNRSEVAFYEGFFARAADWAGPVERVMELAEQTAAQHGLNALDALHVAAALTLGAEEFVTTERSSKPLHRVTGIKVMSI
jgi:predicted nucleic acid-binding protein